MSVKTLYAISIFIIFIIFILIAGCTSVQPTVVETTTPTPTQTSVVVVESNETPIYTVGPTPTTTEDLSRCYWKNTTDYPEICYSYFYWVRPTYSPTGSGYSAKVWQISGCVDLNQSSGYCNTWGDNSFTIIFMKNQTIVRNLSNINVTEVVSAAAYYNRSFNLNMINGGDFNSFVDKYWDGSYPSVKYDTTEFAPDPNIIIPVVNGTFNPEGF